MVFVPVRKGHYTTKSHIVSRSRSSNNGLCRGPLKRTKINVANDTRSVSESVFFGRMERVP